MMNYLYTIILLLFLGSYGYAQEIIRSHFGAFASNTSQNVHWHVGELSSGTKGNTTSNFITAGFIQPNIFINTSTKEILNKIQLRAWPNPTYDVVQIKLEKALSLTYLLLDTHGNILEKKNTNKFNFNLDMSAYPPATYILQLQDAKQIVSVLRIVKIN